MISAVAIFASPPTAPSTAQQLAAAFDAAAAIRADLVLFERDEPGAPAAIRAWAASRGRALIERDISLGMTVLSVATSALRHIDVHLRPEVG